MAKRAERISLLFESPTATQLPGGFAVTLASHLVGRTVSQGERVHLPGWAPILVDQLTPSPAEVKGGTQVEVHVPPPTREGALNLAVLVDASLTMGKGDPSKFDQAAGVLDAVLLNGRPFLQRAGIVVQGGTTRHTEALRDPGELSGASILQVAPTGTFDLSQGVARAVKLLEGAGPGPRGILVLTDGTDAPGDPLAVARPALRAGIPVVVLADTVHARMAEMAEETQGIATTEAQEAFGTLARLAGTEASWTLPDRSDPDQATPEEPYEFEVVVEALET